MKISYQIRDKNSLRISEDILQYFCDWELKDASLKEMKNIRLLQWWAIKSKHKISSKLSWKQYTFWYWGYFLFSSVQSLIHFQLFVTPWTAACQASLSTTSSQSLLRLMSIESVMPSKNLILCLPLFFPPSIFPSIRVFSNESAFLIRWPKYCSFSFSISPSNEHRGLISFRMAWLDLLAVQGTLKSLLHTTVQKHQFFSVQLSLQSNSHIHTWLLGKPKLWLDRPLLGKVSAF